MNPSYQKILSIALPVIAANLLLPVQGLIDTSIMGHFNEATYLAALGLASAFFSLIYASFNFLQYASSGLSAQALGKKNYHELIAIIWRAWVMVLLLAAIILLTFPLLNKLAVIFFTMNHRTEALFDRYSHIRIWGVFAELGIYTCMGWFAGQGLGKYILIQQIVLTASNIIISLTLVYGWQLKIQGVAYGTVLASYIAFACSAWMIYRWCKAKKIPFRPKSYIALLQWKIIGPLLALNRNLFIRTVSLVFCLIWFQKLSSQQGEDYLAANVILLWLLTIASYGLDGIAIAIESFSGQAFAQKDKALLQIAIKKTFLMATLLALILCGSYLWGFQLFLSLMTSLDHIKSIANNYRYWAIFLPLIGVWGYLLDGYFFGTTQAAILRNAMLVVTLVTILSSFLLVNFWGNAGVWMSIYLFLFLRAFILLPTFLRQLLHRS